MTNDPLKCSAPGCNLIAEWKPVVVVKTPENDRSFELAFAYFMCDEHKQKLTVDDIVGNSNIETLKKMFKEKFIYPPKKENMSLKWETLYISIFTPNGSPIGKTPLIR